VDHLVVLHIIMCF